MPVPDFQSFLLPLLRQVGAHDSLTPSAAKQLLAREFSLSEEDLSQLLPSGSDTVFANRVGWARTYLKKAGLLDMPNRGVWCITPLGKKVLAEGNSSIDVKYLRRFPEFLAWHTATTPSDSGGATQTATDGSTQTPAEALSSAFSHLQNTTAQEILASTKECSPGFFERLVVDVLVKMGYGGSRKDAGEAVGRSGDGGIDGIIKEDRLGLDRIYLQAKRWEGTVGRPEVQKFAGALQEHHARKGVFLTTGAFSSEAKDYVSKIDTRIVLIDGETLARLMIEHDVGVTTIETYRVKRLDADYFSED